MQPIFVKSSEVKLIDKFIRGNTDLEVTVRNLKKDVSRFPFFFAVFLLKVVFLRWNEYGEFSYKRVLRLGKNFLASY
jgi:hypothetical protein